MDTYEQVSEGQLALLRKIVSDHIGRNGDQSSFVVSSGVLMRLIQEVQALRAEPA